jgi:hypothetical protein
MIGRACQILAIPLKIMSRQHINYGLNILLNKENWMFVNFTRRHKLDYEQCDLRYQFVPPPFRYDLLKHVIEAIEKLEGSTFREYSLYRHLSVSLNKDYQQFYGEDEIHEFYSTDLFIDLVRSAKWHEVLSMVEYLVRAGLIKLKTVNELMNYHRMGYVVKKSSDGVVHVEVNYESVVKEAEDAQFAVEPYPAIVALLSEARQALVSPTAVSPATAVSSAVKAIEAFLKEWLAARNIKVTTMGDAIKVIRSKALVNPHINEALHQFYIYRNNQPNVGHGSAAETTVTSSDAALVLDMAASFINYFHRKAKAEPE